jgi:hypothetical protein
MKRGRVFIDGGSMIILPLKCREVANDDWEPRYGSSGGKPVPVDWQSCKPFLVPDHHSLSLTKGELFFLVIHMRENRL